MKVLKSVLAVSLALATCGAAVASTGGAGITGTRHDFATRTNFLGSQVLDTKTGFGAPGVKNQVGQCAFCHTPHNALSTLLLWNKTPSQNTFRWDVDWEGKDNASTTGGTKFAAIDGKSYKGPTAKCLACHDGSVAIGDVRMYKGKYDKTYNNFTVGQQPVDYDGKTFKTGVTGDARPQFVIGSGGSMNGSHPVAMPYPDIREATYNWQITGTDVVLGEFQPLNVAHQVNNASLGGGLSTSTNARTATGLGNQASLIKLYSDIGNVIKAGTARGQTGMECSTCHDPHNKQTVDDWMLRGVNAGSTIEEGYICLQCHIK